MSLGMPVAQTNQILSRQKYKYMSAIMSAIGKKKAKPRTQNTAEEKKAKPLYSTELKPVLMFTKTELRESAAQIKGIGPQRTEKIWRMMPFSSAFHEADDWEVEYILMKLVELRGLESMHFYMEEYKHNKALADVHLAAMLAQSQARANRANRSLNPPSGGVRGREGA